MKPTTNEVNRTVAIQFNPSFEEKHFDQLRSLIRDKDNALTPFGASFLRLCEAHDATVPFDTVNALFGVNREC